MSHRSGRQTRRANARAIEWPTVGLLLACHGLWLATGLFIYPAVPVLALAIMAILVAFHSSLQHEVLHGHPTASRRLNEAFVFLPLGLFYPYRRYRSLHLKHHADERLTDPYDDPESYYRALCDWEALPAALKALLAWNNTLIGRLTVGPALALAGFLMSEVRLLTQSRRVRLAWLLHLAGLVPVLLVVDRVFGIPLWHYAMTSAYGGMSLIAIRSYCEHQWSERPDGRTIIVEKSPLALLFLNNNLHLVHHKRPAAPWYALPALYEAERDKWRAMNEGYVFGNYWQIVRAFAFLPKEPVAHPAWRRTQTAVRSPEAVRHGGEPGLTTGASMPVPARPPKE
ncbi:Fatty acid desaturase [Hartmannibacter diazotrophicus]|uniref:Fatty acid desaturase n=1 Tax=Hartmannibacter diazotrophicus TaxID=1482074 RepID=A0A2C9DD01_9HYPH|nr:fatty acid desaturase [Hartmannibacter diazotrophicus]SON58049.1 Fatty acid desaturase [Hartmannibacter diazotrophicus]